jgi:hypothetical protein
LIGNVLGSTQRPHTRYELTSGSTSFDQTIFVIGTGAQAVANDPNTGRTLMRWGNWDVVNNAARFLASEVPTGIANLANPVPSTQVLPASFYLTAKPNWWPSAKPWPPIGPDVTGGNLLNVGGHAYSIPAQDCYTSVMVGPANGTGSVLPFDALACFSGTGGTLPSAPTNLRIIR